MIDLDAAKSARREALGEAPTVRFGGREFGLPAELPFPVVLLLADLKEAQDDPAATAGVIAKIVQGLLGEEYQAFVDAQPSLDDLTLMLEGLMAAYGMGLGESSASESSSGNTSRPSKPASKASTA